MHCCANWEHKDSYSTWIIILLKFPTDVRWTSGLFTSIIKVGIEVWFAMFQILLVVTAGIESRVFRFQIKGPD